MFRNPLWSKWQRRGIVILTIMGVFLFLIWRYECYRTKESERIQRDAQDLEIIIKKYPQVIQMRCFDPNKEDSAGLVSLGLKPWIARNVCRYRDAGGRFRKSDDLRKIYGMSDSLFERLAPYIRITEQENRYSIENVPKTRLRVFDPNTEDSAGLVSLGLKPWMARNVCRYRDAGGRFRKLDDLRKIYGMTDTLMDSLRPYIMIQERTDSFVSKKNDHEESVATKEIPFNYVLNVVSETTLAETRGIGKSVGARIIRYGRQLGGYRSVDQLDEALKGMDEAYIAWLKSHFSVDTTQIKRINVNQCSMERLYNHPYINFFEAKSIYEHRREYGRYKSLEQLRQVEELDNAFFQRVMFYLTAK